MSKIKIQTILILSVLFLTAQTATGEIIYVDADAVGANVGANWMHAINSLQDALLIAHFSDKPVEIRVAQGIYTPDRGLGIMPGDREASFELINGVTIKGGYAGYGSPNPNERDIKQYETILSGDLNYNDAEVAEPENLLEGPTRAENSYHVVTCSDTDETAVLDGFIIKGGVANGDWLSLQGFGGGMIIMSGKPTVKDCTFALNAASEGGGVYNQSHSNLTIDNCRFEGNYAGDLGGGMENNESNPTLINCLFADNAAPGGGGLCNRTNSYPSLLNCVFIRNSGYGNGGGMYNHKSNPTLNNCRFIENSGGGAGGGGIYNEESNPTLADCTIRDNSTTGSGGGMYNNNSNPMLLSCIFSGNTAPRSGGGMYNRYVSQPSLNNCIFSGNSASYGGGMENLDASRTTLLNCTLSGNFAENAGGGTSNTLDGRITLFNCILWDNHDASDMGESSQILGSAEVRYSCVQHIGRIPWSGEGNINTNPYFADPDNGDYHLKSQAGRWDPASESWVVDEISSPCIDAGNPVSRLGLERFPNGGRINMGAYGGTPEASLSPQRPEQPPSLPTQASNPTPADGAVDVDVNVILKWTVGHGAVLHNVYFGPSINEMLLVSLRQSMTEFNSPGTLAYGLTYYWRIDEVNQNNEVITGEVWSFTTVTESPRPKGRACFVADTPVWINGTLSQISKVAAGQTVGKTACIKNKSMQIEKLQEHEGTFVCYDILLESGNCISAVECHYFLTESGRWMALQNLKAGTKLQTSKGPIGVTSVTKRSMPYVGKVYNLKVEGSDRYTVGEDAVIVRDY